MKAVVFKGVGKVSVDEVPMPRIEKQSDVILKVTNTAICGSDLHLYDGYNPSMKAGDILGHEFMGVIAEVGEKVTRFKVGDRVLIPFPICCGACFYCREGLWSLCENSNPDKKKAEALYGYSGAALYGYSHLYGGIPGGQAEFVRVLDADVNAFHVPPDIKDEKALFLTDIFPTGYMAAENAMQGTRIETVAIFGAGPVGQFTIKSLFLLGARRVIAIDKVQERLAMAAASGAEIIDFGDEKDIVEALKRRTGNQGPDAVVDAAGMEASGHGVADFFDKITQEVMIQQDRPTALRDVIQSCRKGGVVSIPGVYSGFIDRFPMGSAFAKGLTLRMGQTHVHSYLDKLAQLILDGRIDPSFVITHRLPLSDAPKAYRMFRDKENSCIKVVMKP